MPNSDIYLVVYDVDDARPYAAAFSSYALACAFAKSHEGAVIYTQIDAHVDLIEESDNDAA